MLRDGLVRRLERLEADADVREVVVVTHVPLFEAQIVRQPGDRRWEISNAYFGNLTTGQAVLRFPKVRYSPVDHPATRWNSIATGQ